MVQENTENCNTWSVLRRPDSPAFSLVYGYGYVANDSRFDNEAVNDGWEVLATGLQPEIAVRMRDIYKAAGKVETATPDLSDVLSYDFTEYQEDRYTDFCELFDLVSVPYNGLWIEGTVTDITEDYIEIDGYYMVAMEDAIKGELIAKADADCGFVKTYGAWLDQLTDNMEVMVTYAISAQSKLEHSEAA